MSTYLRVYGSDGTTPRGMLTHPSELSVQTAFNDCGAMTCKYPRNAPNAHLLDLPDAFIAVVADGQEQREWFLLEEDTENDADEAGAGRLITVSTRGTLALFERAVVYPSGHRPGGSVAGMETKHAFNDATPGAVMVALLARAQARGALPGVRLSFSATQDSNGRAWPKRYDVSYAAGITYLSVLQAMTDNGWADLRMDRLTLNMYVPDSTSRDLPDVILRRGRQVLEGPRKRSRRGITSVLLGVGAEKNAVEVSDAGSVASRGRREGYAADGRMTTSGSLREMATAALQKAKETREGFSLTVALDPPHEQSWPQPGISFDLGDFIRYDQRRLNDTTLEPLRVRTINWGWSNSDAPRTCAIELNDVFVESSIRLARRVAGITNGSVVSGPVPEPATEDNPVNDKTAPKAPASVGIETSVYDEQRRYRVSAKISWPEVSLNVDDTPYIDHQHYEVETRTWFGAKVPDWVTAGRVVEAVLWADKEPPGALYQARVRAVDKAGNVSLWRESEPVFLPKDEVPPPKPSTPVVDDFVGTLRIVWDGKDYQGAAMPWDFTALRVHVSTNPAATISEANQVDVLTGASASVQVDLPYGVEQFVWFQAVDIEGNVSEVSDRASATPRRVTGDDLGSGVVGASALAFKDLGNLIPDGSFELPATRARLNSAFPAWTARSGADAGHGANYMRMDLTAARSIQQVTLGDAFPVVPGDQFYVTFMSRMSSDVPAGEFAGVSIIKRDASGATLSSEYAPARHSYNGTWFRTAGTVSVGVGETNVQFVQAAFYVSSAVRVGTIDIDAVEVRRMVGTAIIQQASITTAKIADLAVDDAKIANLSVGKLRAGSLTADVTISGRIATAASGRRTEINQFGVHQYTGSGNIADVSINPDGSWFKGAITARTFYSAGYETYGSKYIEMGDVAGTEANDEMRFINGGYVSSIRNPVGAAGRLRFSMQTAQGGIGNQIDMDPEYGLMTQRVTFGSPTANSADTHIRPAIGNGGGGILVHDGGMAYSTTADLVIGSAENLHGWISNGQVGIKFLYSSPVLQVRTGNNGAFGDLRVRNIQVDGSISGAGAPSGSGGEPYRATTAGTADNAMAAENYGNTLRLAGAENPLNSILMKVGSYSFVRIETHRGDANAGLYVNGPFGAYGEKKFIIPHPMDTDRWLAHAATESPTPGVEYWGEIEVGQDGTAEVQMPRYFEALTRKDHRAVFLTSLDGAGPATAGRVVDGAFPVKGEPGSTVYWNVKADRGDVDFDPEARVDAKGMPAPLHLYDFPDDDEVQMAHAMAFDEAAARDAAT